MKEIRIGRVAKAAGITREQARLAMAAVGDPPSGGPHYASRMAYLREAAEALGLKGVWRMTDVTLEKRLSRYPRVAAIIGYAKEADLTNAG